MSQGLPEEQTTTRPRRKRRGFEERGGSLEILLALLVVLALFLGLVRPYMVEAFRVPSESMVPTLLTGDRLLVNKFIYRFTEPQRGQVIVFESERNESESTDDGERYLVKRVLGLPGDEVEVRDGVLFLNSVPQQESYLNPNPRDESSFGPAEVPPDHVFVMGDNRADSEDSRSFGPVPEENIVGEAFLRAWPPSRMGLPY